MSKFIPAAPYVICGEKQASCICGQAPDHDSPHLCPCGGSWAVVDGIFKMVAAPSSNPDWEVPV